MLTVELPSSPPLPDHAQQLLDLQLYGQAFLEQRDALAVLMRYLQQPLSVPSSYVLCARFVSVGRSVGRSFGRSVGVCLLGLGLVSLPLHRCRRRT